ncbi:hypothetical protein [Humisphaera borealis]|uniref:Outer membrane protein beta-barrel domain-containing protein n=1 Tax=Humisphaera borealis TaxID=2807512 RepID=A0A7M2WWG0_9BACT|nr:hypothetical protein [Humisphaera borealis]QOV89806.1 hypothetical protein IPV69_00070 [Humisphaera borealis]
MRLSSFLATAAFSLTAGLFVAPSAFAQDKPITGTPEFSLGIGYANVSVGSSSSELNGQNALRVDPVVSFSPFAGLPQLRLGASAGVSMVLDNSQRSLIVNNGSAVFIGSSEMPFVLFTPEARLSWRQTFGRNGEFFIEPGIGGGVALGWLNVDSEVDPDNSIDKTDVTWEARAFLHIGARVTGGTFGIEMSYMRGGDMTFADNARGDVSEFYVGVFGALQF